MHEWLGSYIRHKSRGSFSVALTVAVADSSLSLSLSMLYFFYILLFFSNTFIIITISGKSWTQTHEKESETLRFSNKWLSLIRFPLMASIL
jgi:hypothetical protein